MEYDEVLRRRRSCRAYDERPVEREKLAACMEAGRTAPSGCNTQRWMFIAVDDAEKCALIADAVQSPPEIGVNKFAYKVPAFIVMLYHPPRKELNEKQVKILEKFNHPDIDLGLAAGQICLKATDLGLGSVMLGWFEQEPIKSVLGIPGELSVALVIGLGYPKNDAPGGPRRYTSEQVCRWGSFEGE